MILDIEDHLLNELELSPSERAEVLLNRATRQKREEKLQEARATLHQVKGLQLDHSTAERAEKLLREVVLRIGDEVDITAELLDAPLRETAFAYARRGSVALAARGRLAAARWYDEALKYARDGDEKTAALFGVQACTDPVDWARQTELENQRLSILKEERPRTERIWALQDNAGGKLLSMYRAGEKAKGHEISQAIESLRDALTEADDMGWPWSVRPNLITASDSLALSIVGLLIADESSAESLQQALVFSIERGIFGVARHFDANVLERIAPAPDLLASTRDLLTVRKEAAFRSRARALLRSALLPLLSDEQIVEHVIASVDVTQLVEADFFEKTATEGHLEILSRHYLVMPAGAASHLIRAFSAALRADLHAKILRAEWLYLPLGEWLKVGSVESSDPAFRDLFEALRSIFERNLVRTDSFVRRMALRLMAELCDTPILLDTEKEALATVLDAEIEHAMATAADRDKGTTILELATARRDFSEWVPPEKARSVFLAACNELRNSTAFIVWINAISVFAAALSAEERATVAHGVMAYVEATLTDRHRTFGPFPEWAAEAVCQAVAAGIITSSDALSKLRTLGEKYPQVLCRIVELPGIDLAASEEQMLAARTKRQDDYSFMMWCQEFPAGDDAARLERIALGELHAPDARTRQLAYWSAAALAKKGALSDVGRAILAEEILKFGATDCDWRARFAAVGSAARVLRYFSVEQLDELVARASKDEVANVRRAAALVSRARVRDTNETN